MALRILHTSDWHLGAPMNWGPKRGQGDWVKRARMAREEAVTQIVARAQAERVTAVLVAGDVLDQPDLPYEARSGADIFLRGQVIDRLKEAGIRLVITPGTHDGLKKDGRPTSASSLQLLGRLVDDHRGYVDLLMPKTAGGLPSADRVEFGEVWVSPAPPPEDRRLWIEFLHSDKWSCRGEPVYRAFGDRHVLTRTGEITWQPGTPLARSSGADNNYTDLGPRFVLIANVTSGRADVNRQQLDVAEVAVLKKEAEKWSLLHSRDDGQNRCKREPLTERSAVSAVLRAAQQLRTPGSRVGLLTVVLPPDEDPRVAQNLLREVKRVTTAGSITGSRPGILSLRLEEAGPIPSQPEASVPPKGKRIPTGFAARVS